MPNAAPAAPAALDPPAPAARRDEPVHLDPMAFAVAAAGVGIWEMDLETGEELWSDQTLALYGLPPGSVAPNRRQWRERFVHPGDLPRIEARVGELMREGRPYEMEYRIRRADSGAWRWLHTRAAFAFGGRRRVLGMTIDVTERVEAEERARETARLLDHAAEQVGFGFGYREPGGERGQWSPHLKRLFGLPPEGPTPDRRELLAVIAPEDHARVMRELTTPIGEGELREFEFGVNASTAGLPRRLRTRAATQYEQGQPRRTYFALVDVTEQRVREQRVQALLVRLQMATEASGVGIWERDLQQGRHHWDTLTLAHFDLPPGSPALERDDFLARVHPEDRERVAAALRLADEHLRPIDVEYRVIRPGGGERWLRTRGRVELDAEGRPLRSIGVCFDTTRQREAEAARQARELAESASAAKTEFLSRMSHELRTPLNAVLGFAQLLLLDEAEPLSAAQRERVGHVQAAGWHLLALVNDVLDVARIESRQAQLVLGAVPVPEVVAECLAMNAPEAEARGLRVRAELPATLHAWADRTRLKQVLVNLVSNATKYNRPGGELLVRAMAVGGQMELQVHDSGEGLDAAQLARLFEPFNRLGRERGAIEGTGIGLTLSKLLVEQMGGCITVASRVGEGSVFTLRLPLRDPG